MKYLTGLVGILVGLSSVQALAADVPAVTRVAVVVFENADYADVLRAPFFADLARRGALATHMLAETHPSQGNYIALTSGDLHGVRSDGNVDLAVRHIGDLLEEAGKTWKVYAENYPGNCFTRASSGNYVRKHNPFMSFTNVSRDPTRCANVVDASQLDRDVAAGALPDFIFYVPNLQNDGHNTDVTYADRWFNSRFSPLFQDPRFMDGLLFVATYDESSLHSPQNQIYTAFFGDMVQPGAQYTASSSHYAVLKTIELALGLGNLGLGDANAAPLTGIWR